MIQPPSQRDPIVDESGRVTNVYQRWFADLSKAIGSAAPPVPPAPEPPDPVDHGTIQGLGSIQTFGVLPNIVQLSLEGDDVAPGQTFYYGTGQSSDPEESHVARGWHPVSGAMTQGPGLSLTIGANGVTTFALDELPDAGGGTLQKTERDQYGRVAGTSEATTTDLPEGANLYHTDERVDARIDAQKGVAGGIATLDANSKLDAGQLPALAITETFVVNTEAAMLALDVQQGDVAVRSDLQASFILTAEPATVLSNWQELLIPTGVGVASFNGRAGAVTSQAGDYTAAQVGADPAGSAAAAQAAANAYTDSGIAGKVNKSGDVMSGNLEFSSVGAGLTAPNGSSIQMRDGVYGLRLQSAGSLAIFSSGRLVPSLLLSGASCISDVIWLPSTDGGVAFGGPSSRWSEIYAVNGTINTSDSREKTEPRDLTEAELAAAGDIARLPCIFRWLHAIEEKGEDARLHASPTVQSVIAAMESHGLDPFRYGFVCFDAWDEQPEIRDEETGEVTQEYRPAGDRYSLRPTELAHFVMRGLAHRQDELERRLAALESE